jgi:hypothetical protein
LRLSGAIKNSPASPGDNILVEFPSGVDALRCAWDFQKETKSRNLDLPENRRMTFRIGINIGDVIEEDGRIYGDGVNVAARIESLAEAGGISISGTVHILEFKKEIERNPENITALVHLASSYSLSGRNEEAKNLKKEVEIIDPDFSLKYFEKSLPYKHKSDTDPIINLAANPSIDSLSQNPKIKEKITSTIYDQHTHRNCPTK